MDAGLRCRYLDGEEVRRIIGTSTVTSLTNPQSLRFNLWSHESADWVGAWDDSVLPVYQFVNYIDYKSYNADTDSFEDAWRDDFDSFNSARWGKANWTFDQNRVDFAEENVIVKDGILILALTHENATGFSGNPPADEPASSSSSESSVAISSSAASSSPANASSASSESSSASDVSVSSSAAASVASSRAANSGGGGGGAMDEVWLIVLGGLLFARRKLR
jgi:endo-1,3-1,4-beta-glycanase ExoK